MVQRIGRAQWSPVLHENFKGWIHKGVRDAMAPLTGGDGVQWIERAQWNHVLHESFMERIHIQRCQDVMISTDVEILWNAFTMVRE